MKTVDAKQGTPEWHVHRSTHFNASDAPAMMGCSPYKTRAQLIKETATGLGEEVTPEVQQRFDDGHRAEKLARPLAEAILGEDLYPMVGAEGPHSASFDGITLDDRIVWEHKSLNDTLRAALPLQGVGDESVGAALPMVYRVQMEQQAAISGCERVLFTASKWRGDVLVEARHCWYRPDTVLRQQLFAGWQQFEADVAGFKPGEVVAPLVAEAVEALPAVLVKVAGEITVTANFGLFETKLRAFLKDDLIREPKTDQDFVDLDQQIKAMKAGREALKGAKAQMLAQVQPVDVATKTADMLDDLLQKNCSMAEALLKNEKERRKTEIVMNAQAKLRDHLAELETRLGRGVMPGVHGDFGGVVKGLKTLASMEDKLASELARAKIEANRIADLIDANRKQLAAAEADHLFPDFAQVCAKAAEDFANLITSRKAAAAQRLEAERERIRKEEAARLEREQQARADAEARQRREDEAAATRQREEAEAAAPAADPAPYRASFEDAQSEIMGIQQQVAIAVSGRLGVRKGGTIECLRQTLAETEALTIGDHLHVFKGTAQAAKDKAVAEIRALLVAAEQKAAAPAPAPEVRAFHPAAAALRTEQPTLTLGEIKTRIAPLSIDAAGLESLGFPATKVKAACMYRHSDWPEIRNAMAKVLARASEQQQAA